MFARLIEGLDQHNIRVLPSMKITLIYSRQDIPTKWESWEISHKSDISQVVQNVLIFQGNFYFNYILGQCFCHAKKNWVLFQKLLSRAYIGPLKKLLKFSNIQYPL